MTCGEYVENMLIFAQYSTHILSNQQLVTSTVPWDFLWGVIIRGILAKDAYDVYISVTSW